jgi:hypothetical protein
MLNLHADAVRYIGKPIGIVVLLAHRVLLGAPLEQENVAVVRHISGVF